MKKTRLFAFIGLLALAAALSLWYAATSQAVQYTFPAGTVTPQVVTASGAAQSNAATLTGSAGRMTYLEGFDVTGGGATAASIVEISTTGLSNNLKWEMNVLAGVAGPVNAQGGLFIRFPTPIPSSATNTNITVTLPSLGAGNTNASITVYGYTQ
jgi:hypothetical protein